MVELSESQAIAKLQMDERRLNYIQNQANTILRSLEEIKMTSATIENLPDKGSDGLMPLGGVFIPVSVKEDKIKVNMGAGVVVEQTRQEALETLKKREESLGQTLQKLQELGEKVNAEALELQRKLSERQQGNVPVISG